MVFNGEYQNHSSVGFYLARQVLLLNGRTTVLEFGSHYPDSPPVFIDQPELARLWAESKRIFLVTNNDKFEDVKKSCLARCSLLPWLAASLYTITAAETRRHHQTLQNCPTGLVPTVV